MVHVGRARQVVRDAAPSGMDLAAGLRGSLRVRNVHQRAQCDAKTRTALFFAKKKPRTLINKMLAALKPASMSKSFLVLFFKKELFLLWCLVQVNCLFGWTPGQAGHPRLDRLRAFPVRPAGNCSNIVAGPAP
jgi:hypothetical protein